MFWNGWVETTHQMCLVVFVTFSSRVKLCFCSCREGICHNWLNASPLLTIMELYLCLTSLDHHGPSLTGVNHPRLWSCESARTPKVMNAPEEAKKQQLWLCFLWFFMFLFFGSILCYCSCPLSRSMFLRLVDLYSRYVSCWVSSYWCNHWYVWTRTAEASWRRRKQRLRIRRQHWLPFPGTSQQASCENTQHLLYSYAPKHRFPVGDWLMALWTMIVNGLIPCHYQPSLCHYEFQVILNDHCIRLRGQGRLR